LAQQMIMERDYLHALEQLEDAISSDSSPSLLLELAQLKFSLNDLSGAADLAEKAAAADPGLGGVHKLLGDIHLSRARDGGDADALGAALEFEKKYDEAIAVYMPFLEGETESSYVRKRIGTLHLLAGRYQDAIQNFQRAQEIDPADTRSLLSLAQAYQEAGDMDAAIRSYEHLIQKEPGNLEARLHRALLWQKEGDTAAALKSYREIIDMATGRGH